MSFLDRESFLQSPSLFGILRGQESSMIEAPKSMVKFKSGMKRSSQEGKTRYDLIEWTLTRAMLRDVNDRAKLFLFYAREVLENVKRGDVSHVWIHMEHMVSTLQGMGVGHIELTKRVANQYEGGLAFYGEDNWKKATGQEERLRAAISGYRHTFQYILGYTNEDHLAAAFFNWGVVAYVEKRTDFSKKARKSKN